MTAAAWVLTWKGALAAYGIACILFTATWAIVCAPSRRHRATDDLAEANRRNREARDALTARQHISPEIAAILKQLDRRYYDREFAAIIQAEAKRRHPSNRTHRP